jgi:hypothetical protein
MQNIPPKCCYQEIITSHFVTTQKTNSMYFCLDINRKCGNYKAFKFPFNKIFRASKSVAFELWLEYLQHKSHSE